MHIHLHDFDNAESIDFVWTYLGLDAGGLFEVVCDEVASQLATRNNNFSHEEYVACSNEGGSWRDIISTIVSDSLWKTQTMANNCASWPLP